jgi:hypothetical protein
MMTRLSSALIALALILTPLAPTAAQTSEEIAAAVPIDIPEVVSGGEWQDGGSIGAYRAVVLLAPLGNEAQALVFVQWIGAKDANSPLDIVQNIAIKDVSDRKLPMASIAIEAEKENEAIIIVTSADPKTQAPIVLAYKATKPGVIAPTAVPDEYKPQPPAPAGKADPKKK